MSNKVAYLATAVVVLSEAVNLLHTASTWGKAEKTIRLM
jgi:hypothetical protein